METRDVGASQSVLFGTVQHVDVGILAGDFVGERPGSIGRIVVDDEHIEHRWLGHETLDELRQIVALIVGRDDDQGVGGHASGGETLVVTGLGDKPGVGVQSLKIQV